MSKSCEVTPKKGDVSISSVLGNFDKLRISALTKAAEISPMVKEVTIGPNSPVDKEKLVKLQLSPILCDKKIEENLTEDKLGDDLRYTLIMKEYESRIKDSSEEIFKNLIDKMIAKRAETMSKFWKKQSEECDRRAKELQARKWKMLRELQDNDSFTVIEEANIEDQNSIMINQKTIENMNKILEEQNMATARFASVTDSHTKICICFNEVNNLLHTDPIAKKLTDNYTTTLNSVMTNINCILDQCKTGTITEKIVKQAEVLVSNIQNIRTKINEDIKKELQHQALLKQEEEDKILKEKQLEEARKAEEAQKAQKREAELEQAKLQAKQTPPMFYSPSNHKYYEDLRNFLIQYESLYKGLMEDTAFKKFRFDCQKAVNTPVNAISSISGAHIRDKFDKLSKLLKGERVQVLDTYVQATQHPQGLPYVTALLAKKIVRQGDLLVSSNPEAAFPLASVTVALWAQFPEFGKLLEAYFHRECPYLVPMFLPQTQGQTDQDFYKSRGYTYNDEGVVEKQDKFLKRMSGIFRLRCAIWVAKTPRFVNAHNPHGLRYGWQWIASFINLKPEPDICATLLHDFFTICGSEYFKVYGKQFGKIIKLICTDYLKILENIDEGGPKTRLEVFLQNVLKSGHIPAPSGLLAPNTW